VVSEDELRLRHLETIQSTVGRLSQHSFAVPLTGHRDGSQAGDQRVRR
jgi:hypothetical protein